MLNESELESYFSELLSCRLIFAVVHDEISETDLTTAEIEKLQEMKHERRRSSWLKGRRALKSILKKTESLQDAACCQIDTMRISMPNSRISLTHSQDFAIAVASLDDCNGLGIDLESHRVVREASTRFYLNAREQEQIESAEHSASNDDLLRLWTIKESLFKSDLKNKDMTILKYGIEDAKLNSGFASIQFAEDLRKFKYASKKFGEYWLSVSLAVAVTPLLDAGGTPVSTAGAPSQQAMGSGRSVLPGSTPTDPLKIIVGATPCVAQSEDQS